MPARSRRRVSTQFVDRPDFRRNDIELTVSGFKAVRDSASLRVAPLTIIAGSNSSGKSSFIQTLLLMKQTLESAFDPGPLLLYGPNAKFTSHTQVLSRGKSRSDVANEFDIQMSSDSFGRKVTFAADGQGLHIDSDEVVRNAETLRLSEALTAKARDALRAEYAHLLDGLSRGKDEQDTGIWDVVVQRNRCFLEPSVQLNFRDRYTTINAPSDRISSAPWVNLIRGIIHVPGLRGNPERAYPRSAVGATYPGTFETYVASIVNNWADTGDPRLTLLASDLEALGLTWKVVARKVNDASVELLVGRLPHAQQGGANDLVSVADVGFGVSQTLPVVVALHAATPGQLVYIEQPEIHLHPRAQLALVDCLVNAASRGVKVIAETHSSLLIRGIQTAVARDAIEARAVSMNWFSRDSKSGVTSITPAELDDQGRFGEWPVDFDDISQDADWAYLEAVRDAS